MGEEGPYHEKIIEVGEEQVECLSRVGRLDSVRPGVEDVTRVHSDYGQVRERVIGNKLGRSTNGAAQR